MAEPALQRFILQRILALPTPLLRGLSGGGVVYQGGRTLDPRFQFFANAAKRQPSLTIMSPDDARRASAMALAALKAPLEKGVKTEPLAIEGDGGPIPCRVYHPPVQDSSAPVLVYAHMGGGVIGDLDTCDAFCSILAKVGRCVVVSADYRLAPDHRFPAGLEDVLTVYRWVRENTARYGAPVGHVAIGGDSMGGNFAAVVAQEMKRKGEPQPAFQLLIYPATDVASETQSMTTYADAYPLSRPLMEWFVGHYLGAEGDPADARLSPIKMKDLAGLAPAIVVTAGFDPLVDQGEAYARRLRDAAVPVIYRCYDSLAHGFTAFTAAVPKADCACREIAGLVRETIEGRLAPKAA
ncbi:MAG TPA: alpha/beta hydrolase [Caulobacteraceae bacterium]|nr:alpha/beta hydrolase [Caulobacteraceae bacterium]